MATDNVAVDGAEDGAETPASGGKKKLIILIAAVLVLAGGGFAAWKAFSGKTDEKAEAAKVEQLPPRYINLDPPFVVNFEAESTVRFLQVTVGVMTRDPAVEQIIKDNDPRLRNDLLMILGNQSYATVSTLEGKEALRTRCLESVRAIVKEMHGDAPKVEALYFTSFVMQ
jgi:flagellar FliL protein